MRRERGSSSVYCMDTMSQLVYRKQFRQNQSDRMFEECNNEIYHVYILSQEQTPSIYPKS
jgi:hypothetical protein